MGAKGHHGKIKNHQEAEIGLLMIFVWLIMFL